MSKGVGILQQHDIVEVEFLVGSDGYNEVAVSVSGAYRRLEFLPSTFRNILFGYAQVVELRVAEDGVNGVHTPIAVHRGVGLLVHAQSYNCLRGCSVAVCEIECELGAFLAAHDSLQGVGVRSVERRAVGMQLVLGDGLRHGSTTRYIIVFSVRPIRCPCLAGSGSRGIRPSWGQLTGEVIVGSST